jgi:hypothetical protein
MISPVCVKVLILASRAAKKMDKHMRQVYSLRYMGFGDA